MWPPVIVTVADLESRWRVLTPEERPIAQQRLSDAASELQYQLQGRGVLSPPQDQLWEERYVRVVVEMARRYLLNPESWLEESERIDDYQLTRRRDKAVSAGSMYVTDEELASLVPGRRRRGAFSIILGQT